MSAPALDTLIRDRRVWRGRRHATPADGGQPTGWPSLDAQLPAGGWPEGAVSEILSAADGLGELRLVLPTLARLTRAGRRVVLVAPPYLPYVPAWQTVDVDTDQLTVIDAPADGRAWALEQCLRSGACAAVLGWLERPDLRTLRRLQVAAGTGHALGLLFRDRTALDNPSPATLRIEVAPSRLYVRKCRGRPPSGPIPFTAS